MKILRDMLSTLSKLNKEDLDFTYDNLKINNKPNFSQEKDKDKSKGIHAEIGNRDF